MIIYVPLSQIDDNPFQRRVEYGAIDELAADILRHAPTRPGSLGLQQVPSGRLLFDGRPLTPEKLSATIGTTNGWPGGESFTVQIEFGHRRKRAFEHLASNGNPEYGRMPVNILQLTDPQMLDGVWSENRARRDLSAVEEAELLKEKLDMLKANGGGSQRDVAEAWGLARPTIANRLRLLGLPAEVQQANREGKLSERQCLALAPLAQLQELETAGKKPLANWDASSRPSSWGAPIAPGRYIQHIIDNPDTTSEEVRQFAKRAVERAGQRLPAVIAKGQFAPRPGVYLTNCAGCQYRMNDQCLQTACLDAKKEQHVEETLHQASQELGYDISDRKEDFTPFATSYEAREQLYALYRAGIQANYVLAWRIGENGCRPFATYSHVSDGGAFEDDGRAGIAIGHRGSLTPYLRQLAEASDDPESVVIEDIADAATRAAWKEEARDIGKQLERDAKASLSDAAYHEITDELILALLLKPDREWPDEHEKVVKMLIEFLWVRGDGVQGYGVMERLDSIPALLRRAGCVPAVNPSDDLRRRAVAALAYWADYREYSWGGGNSKKRLEQAIQAFDAAGETYDGELAVLRYELGRALADVTSRIDEDEEEE